MKSRKPARAAAPAPKPTDAPAPAPAASAAPPPAKTPEPAAVAKPPEPNAVPPAPPPAPEADDERTRKGLAAVERREAQFRAEQTRAREELELSRAEVARMKAEHEGKVTSLEQLKGLRPAQLIGELRKLGYGPTEFDAVSRTAWAQTEAGAKDPRALEVAREADAHFAARSSQDEVAALKAQIAELKGEFTKRDQTAAQRETAQRWLDGAVKAIPTDKSTLIGKLQAKSPDRARAALVHIGAELEKATGETPTHAEVIEEFEKRQRAGLEESGVDVDAMLRGAPAAAPAPAAAKPTAAPAPKTPAAPASHTLDVSQPGNGIRPREAKTRPTTHQDRVKAARELRRDPAAAAPAAR